MEICKTCDGQGVLHWTETRYVTLDMAIDAGDRDMEGHPFEEVCEAECHDCGGSGYKGASDG